MHHNKISIQTAPVIPGFSLLEVLSVFLILQSWTVSIKEARMQVTLFLQVSFLYSKQVTALTSMLPNVAQKFLHFLMSDFFALFALLKFGRTLSQKNDT